MAVDDLDDATAERLSSFRAGFADHDEGRDRRTIAPSYYAWKLRDNPFGHGYVSLAVDDEGEIVGSSTGTRKLAWFRGRFVDAVELGDAFTDPAWQRRGIYTSLRSATRDRALADGIELIYSTPNARSAPVSKRTSSVAKPGLDLYLWVLPLAPVRTGLGRRHGTGRSRLATLVDLPASWLLRASAAGRARRAEHAPLDFDDAFDDLDHRIREMHSFSLSRDARALAFRLSQNPESERYGIVASHGSDRRLEAVLVYKDARQSGRRVFIVADMFGVDARALRRVWSRAILTALESEYDLVATWAPRRLRTLLGMLPIPAVPIRRKRVFVHANDMGERVLADDGAWLFAMLDTDNV